MGRRKDPLGALVGGGGGGLVLLLLFGYLICGGESEEERRSRIAHEAALKRKEEKREQAALRQRQAECRQQWEKAKRLAQSFKRPPVMKSAVAALDKEKNRCSAPGWGERFDFSKVVLRARWEALSMREKRALKRRAIARCYKEGLGSAKCCDGTYSDTCPCGGGRGCCSHHGGVCGCDCPELLDELEGE